VQLLIGGIISGVAVGALYGLLGFAVIMLLKATSVANFAQGALATLGAFIVYELVQTFGLSFWVAFVIAVPVMALIGAALYTVALRPNDDADHLNFIIRTLALSLLIIGAVNREWASGQPFTFPTVISGDAAFVVGGVAVSWLTIGTIVIAAALASGFAWFFYRTRLGLMFLGVADRPDIATLLGIRTRRLTAVAWAMAAIISLVTGVLVAPRTLLSSDMMDFYLLYSFTAAVIGGLTSMWGVFLGGVLVGCVDNLVTIYAGPDLGTIAVFILLITVLLLRPSGIFGDKSLVERL
jgi:branched-chain amino acid transport system permease protein